MMRYLLVGVVSILVVIVSVPLTTQAAGSQLTQLIFELDCTLSVSSNGSGTAILPNCAPQQPTIGNVVPNQGQPTVSGLYDAAYGGTLTVIVNGVTYTAGASSQLTTTSNLWTLNLSTLMPPLLPGAYDILIQHTLSDATVLSDTTLNEMIISQYEVLNPTVTPLVTTSGKPVISGTYDPLHTSTLAISIDGRYYELGSSPELTVVGNTWQLNLTGTPLVMTPGAYDVEIMLATLDGQILHDTTVDEVVIQLLNADAPTVNTVTWVGGRPLIEGVYDAARTVRLRVYIDGVWYVYGVDPQLSVSGNTWLLDLSNLISPLGVGTYSIVVQTSLHDGSILGDMSVNEMTIEPETLINVITNPTHSPLASTGFNAYKLVVLAIGFVAIGIVIIILRRHRSVGGDTHR